MVVLSSTRFLKRVLRNEACSLQHAILVLILTMTLFMSSNVNLRRSVACKVMHDMASCHAMHTFLRRAIACNRMTCFTCTGARAKSDFKCRCIACRTEGQGKCWQSSFENKTNSHQSSGSRNSFTATMTSKDPILGSLGSLRLSLAPGGGIQTDSLCLNSITGILILAPFRLPTLLHPATGYTLSELISFMTC